MNEKMFFACPETKKSPARAKVPLFIRRTAVCFLHTAVLAVVPVRMIPPSDIGLLASYDDGET